MKTVLASKEAAAKLMSPSANIITVPELSNVLAPLRTHIDMGVFFDADERLLVVEPSIYEILLQQLEGVRLIKGETVLKADYPNDIAYNCITIGKRLFCHKNSDPAILTYYRERNYELIYVKQGYIKCATAVLNNRAVITDDVGLERIFRKNGIDVLLISKGDVKLKGFDYGFFGGATGVDGNDLVINGALKYHINGDKIRAFVEQYGMSIRELVDTTIYDCGSIFFLTVL